MGKLLKIYIRPKRGELDEVIEAQLVVGTGIEGDHAKGPKRQVTLLSHAAWVAACDELGVALDAGARRANLIVDGIDLCESKSKEIQIGEVIIKITGETKPCPLMDKALVGLKSALTPDWRGGAFGEVRTGGPIKVGDEVRFVVGTDVSG